MTSEASLEYRWPADAASGESAAALLLRMCLEAGEVRASRVTFLDTFDGRLYRHGRVLRVERGSGGRADWVLGDLRGRRLERRISVARGSPPRFAEDVDDEAVENALRSIIDGRALLPQGDLRRFRQRLYPIDREDVSTGEFYLDRYRWTGMGKSAGFAAGRLVIVLPAAASKQQRRPVEDWAESLGLIQPEGDVWLDFLVATGRPSGPGFAPAQPDLAPGLRADLAVKRILLTLLEMMRANEAGMLANLDSEFLHDYRVAIRRSRSVLGQLRGVFPERSIAPLERELCWLGQVTGPVRDLDVYLLEFPHLLAAVPEFMRADLGPLKDLLERRASAARGGLTRSLRSRRYRRFIERWTTFLNKPAPRQPTAPTALQPIWRVAGKRIWKLYRRIITDGSQLTIDQASGEAIHELRKRCKKIRYLTEFVAPLHSHGDLRKAIKDLKALQNHLGAFQDAEVQIAHLREWSADLDRDPAVPAATLMAVGALIGFFVQRQRERVGWIIEAIADFGRKEDRERFRRLREEAG